jgi:hypothetical protein
MKRDDQEYVALKSFLRLYSQVDPGLKRPPHENTPIWQFENSEMVRPNTAVRDLINAIKDTLEYSFNVQHHIDEVAEIDRACAAHGVITLSELRRRYSKKFQSILTRGKIRNEAEYYIIKGIVDGHPQEGTPLEEQSKLIGMLMDFEDRETKKLKKK